MLAGALCAVTLLQGMLMFESYTADKQILEPVDFGTSLLTIGNGEYVPEGTDLTSLSGDMWYEESALEIGNVENRYLTYKITVANPSETEQKIALPMLYYEGYTSRDIRSGEELETEAGPNSRVTVTVPEGYEGTLRVRFEEFWYWRAAEAISLATLLAVIFCTTKMPVSRKGFIGRQDL